VIDGARTRDIQDHNLTLYQLSYDHHVVTAMFESLFESWFETLKQCEARKL
jgi:hypothetical protein